MEAKGAEGADLLRLRRSGDQKFVARLARRDEGRADAIDQRPANSRSETLDDVEGHGGHTDSGAREYEEADSETQPQRIGDVEPRESGGDGEAGGTVDESAIGGVKAAAPRRLRGRDEKSRNSEDEGDRHLRAKAGEKGLAREDRERPIGTRREDFALQRWKRRKGGGGGDAE